MGKGVFFSLALLLLLWSPHQCRDAHVAADRKLCNTNSPLAQILLNLLVPGREEAMRQAGHEIPATGTLWRDLPREQWSVSQKIRMAKKTEFEELAHSGGYRVCVDMAFDHLMPEKARASMVQQVRSAATIVPHGERAETPKGRNSSPSFDA